MINLFITLLRLCHKIDESKFRLTVQCRADQGSKDLVSFWQGITNIPPTKTYKSQIDKRSIGIPTQKQSYQGVCVIEYLDANLQCELQFLGEKLGSNTSINLLEKQLT